MKENKRNMTNTSSWTIALECLADVKVRLKDQEIERVELLSQRKLKAKLDTLKGRQEIDRRRDGLKLQEKELEAWTSKKNYMENFPRPKQFRKYFTALSEAVTHIASLLGILETAVSVHHRCPCQVSCKFLIDLLFLTPFWLVSDASVFWLVTQRSSAGRRVAWWAIKRMHRRLLFDIIFKMASGILRRKVMRANVNLSNFPSHFSLIMIGQLTLRPWKSCQKVVDRACSIVTTTILAPRS